MAVDAGKPPKTGTLKFPLLTENGVMESIRALGLAEPVDGPVGGSLARNAQNWQRITNDPWVLQTVNGCEIEWIQMPIQGQRPHIPVFGEKEQAMLTVEVEKLIQKRAVERAQENDQHKNSPSHAESS